MNDEVYRRSGESERLAGVHGTGLSVDKEKSQNTSEEEFELDKTLNPDVGNVSDTGNETGVSQSHSFPFAERIKRVKESTAKIWSLMIQKGRS